MAFRRAESGCSLSAAQRPWMLRYLRPPYSEKMQGRYVAGAFSEPAGDRLCWNPHTCTARITLAVTPVMRKSPYAGMIFNGLGRPLNLDGVSATLPASMGGNKTPIMDEALLRDPSAKTGSGNITADCGRGSDFRQRRLHNVAECGKCKNHGVSCL